MQRGNMRHNTDLDNLLLFTSTNRLVHAGGERILFEIQSSGWAVWYFRRAPGVVV